MIDPNSQIGEILEKGQKVTDTAISDVATSVKGQIIGEKKPATQTQNTSQIAQPPAQVQSQDVNTASEAMAAAEQTREVVADFYSQSDQVVQAAPSQSSAADEANLAKTREELKKQQELYQSLHKQVYYDPLFAYENKREEKSKAQEIEEEKQVKMQELAQTQAKKDKDLAVRKAQTTVEINRGVSG